MILPLDSAKDPLLGESSLRNLIVVPLRGRRRKREEEGEERGRKK